MGYIAASHLLTPIYTISYNLFGYIVTRIGLTGLVQYLYNTERYQVGGPKMFSANIVFLILAVVYIDTSMGCSCWMEPVFPDRYCNAAIVFRGTVFDETPSSTDNRYSGINTYDVNVTKVYRVTEPAKDQIYGKKTVRLTTSIHGSMCGVNLLLREEYVIAVYSNNSMRIGLCGWQQLYRSLSPGDSESLEEGYQCGKD